MEKEVCALCRFFNSNKNYPNEITAVGECKRYGPTVVSIQQDHTVRERVEYVTVYPKQYPTDWCGDFELPLDQVKAGTHKR